MVTYNEFGGDYLIEKFEGKVTEREYVSLKREEIDQTDYREKRGIVMDFRKSTMKFNKKAMHWLIDFLLRNRAVLENKSIAILTKTMDQLHLSFLFKDHLSKQIPIHIEQFSTKQEAYKWLKSK